MPMEQKMGKALVQQTVVWIKRAKQQMEGIGKLEKQHQTKRKTTFSRTQEKEH